MGSSQLIDSSIAHLLVHIYQRVVLPNRKQIYFNLLPGNISCLSHSFFMACKYLLSLFLLFVCQSCCCCRCCCCCGEMYAIIARRPARFASVMAPLWARETQPPISLVAPRSGCKLPSSCCCCCCCLLLQLATGNMSKKCAQCKQTASQWESTWQQPDILISIPTENCNIILLSCSST